MTLKTNYKNDKFSGPRKYQLVENEDGTVSLNDVTQYLEVGDIFNSDDINATNQAVNASTYEIEQINSIKDITVPASGWTSRIPYMQTISVPGIKEGRPIISQHYIGAVNTDSINRQDEAAACVEIIDVQDGKIVLYCYNERPESDFGISIKGG